MQVLHNYRSLWLVLFSSSTLDELFFLPSVILGADGDTLLGEEDFDPE